MSSKRQGSELQIPKTKRFKPLKRFELAKGWLLDGPLGIPSLCDIVEGYSQDLEGVLSLTMVGHTESVTGLALLPDDSVASSSFDGTVRVWDTTTGQCLRTLRGEHVDQFGFDFPIRALIVLPDGNLALGFEGDDTVCVWDALSGKCMRKFLGHINSVCALASLPDGNLASGSLDRTVRVWDVTTGVSKLTLTGHTDAVTSLLVLKDGKLASGSHDCTIRLWDTMSGACIFTLTGHTNRICALTLLHDGKFLSSSYDGTLRVWDNGTHSLTHIHPTRDTFCTLITLPNGHLAAGEFGPSVQMLDASNGQCLLTIQSATKDNGHYVSAFATLRDSKLAAGDTQGHVHVWH